MSTETRYRAAQPPCTAARKEARTPCKQSICHTPSQDLHQVARNVFRVLTLCGRPQIPVFLGSAEPLIAEPVPSNYWFGRDGLGDAPQVCKSHTTAGTLCRGQACLHAKSSCAATTHTSEVCTVCVCVCVCVCVSVCVCVCVNAGAAHTQRHRNDGTASWSRGSAIDRVRERA